MTRSFCCRNWMPRKPIERIAGSFSFNRKLAPGNAILVGYILTVAKTAAEKGLARCT